MVIDRYGNTSSASIPLALADALDTGRLQPGDHLSAHRFRRRHDLGQRRPALGRVSGDMAARPGRPGRRHGPPLRRVQAAGPGRARTARPSSTCWPATRCRRASAVVLVLHPAPGRPSATTSSGPGRPASTSASPSSGARSGTVHAVLAAAGHLDGGAAFRGGQRRRPLRRGGPPHWPATSSGRRGDRSTPWWLSGCATRWSAMRSGHPRRLRGGRRLDVGWRVSTSGARSAPMDGGHFAADDGLPPRQLAGDTLVSMNLWGFGPSMRRRAAGGHGPPADDASDRGRGAAARVVGAPGGRRRARRRAARALPSARPTEPAASGSPIPTTWPWCRPELARQVGPGRPTAAWPLGSADGPPLVMSADALEPSGGGPGRQPGPGRRPGRGRCGRPLHRPGGRRRPQPHRRGRPGALAWRPCAGPAPPAAEARSFGNHRATILAALVNAALLAAVTVTIFVEASAGWSTPRPSTAAIVVAVAAVAVVVNVGGRPGAARPHRRPQHARRHAAHGRRRPRLSCRAVGRGGHPGGGRRPPGTASTRRRRWWSAA